MCLITDVCVLGRPKMTVSDPKWVAVNSNRLRLWENDATGSRIIIKYVPGPKIDIEISKITIEYSQIDFPQNLTFPIKIPEGYRKININELLQ